MSALGPGRGRDPTSREHQKKLTIEQLKKLNKELRAKVKASAEELRLMVALYKSEMNENIRLREEIGEIAGDCSRPHVAYDIEQRLWGLLDVAANQAAWSENIYTILNYTKDSDERD